MDEPTQLDGRRGSPPRSDAAERGRYADEDPLTFLDQVAARWRNALRDAACPRTGRLASKYRAPPQSVGAALRAVEAPDICWESSLHRIRLSYRTERSSSTCKKLWRCSCRGSPHAGTALVLVGILLPCLRCRLLSYWRAFRALAASPRLRARSIGRRALWRTAHCPMGSLAHFGLRLHCCRLSSRALDAGNPRAGLQ